MNTEMQKAREKFESRHGACPDSESAKEKWEKRFNYFAEGWMDYRETHLSMQDGDEIKTIKHRIWIARYQPWTITGGDVHQSVMSYVEATGPFDLGKGFKGYLAMAPSGKTYVIESLSGAIVGSTLDGVREDIQAADKTYMDTQVSDALRKVAKAETVSPEEFWKFVKGAL